MATLVDARNAVVARLNDATHSYWSTSEIDRYVKQAYLECVRAARVVWDVRYAENLPAGFTANWTWEEAYITFRDGVANFTAAFERPLLTEGNRLGPATHTSPFEANNGHDGAPIPALVELPEKVCELDRPVSDRRAIGVIRPVSAARFDSRYELTEGQVEALVTVQNGLRTIRKVRVPSERADTYTVTGSWGSMRDTTDVAEGTGVTGGEESNAMFSFTAQWEQDGQFAVVHDVGRTHFTAEWESTHAAAWATATNATSARNHTYLQEYTEGLEAGLEMTTQTMYACPRRIPGHHLMGSESFGLARRPYNDGKNVRIEHWRDGRTVSADADEFELPFGADAYLRDYALYRCYERRGPAQDTRLAEHYEARWQRGILRMQRRVKAQQRQRVGQFGGGSVVNMRKGPPRPSLPWQYGVVVR